MRKTRLTNNDFALFKLSEPEDRREIRILDRRWQTRKHNRRRWVLDEAALQGDITGCSIARLAVVTTGSGALPVREEGLR
jgi:hypothetical protein